MLPCFSQCFSQCFVVSPKFTAFSLFASVPFACSFVGSEPWAGARRVCFSFLFFFPSFFHVVPFFSFCPSLPIKNVTPEEFAGTKLCAGFGVQGLGFGFQFLVWGF